MSAQLEKDGFALLSRHKLSIVSRWIEVNERNWHRRKALQAVGPDGPTDRLYDPTDEIGYTGQTDADGAFIEHPELSEIRERAEKRWRDTCEHPWREAAKAARGGDILQAEKLICTLDLSPPVRNKLLRLVLLAKPATKRRRRGKKDAPKHWHANARRYLQQTNGEISDAHIARLCEVSQSVVSRDKAFQALRKAYVVKKPFKQVFEKM